MHGLYRVILILFWLGLGTSQGFAQKYNIKTYTVNSGLPSSFIYDIEFDDFGNIWFASSNGVVKFDGVNYTTFSVKEGLRDPLIFDIYLTESQDLWVSTELGGVALLKNDSLQYLPELAFLDSMQINTIGSPNNTELWFGTSEHGVIIWNLETQEQQNVTKRKGLPSDRVWDFNFLDQQTTIISTHGGVAYFEGNEGIVKVITGENGLNGERVYHSFIDKDNNAWFSTNIGVTRIDEDGNSEYITNILGEELGYVYHVTQDENGKIWLASERNGIYWITDEGYEHITKWNGLSSNNIFRFVKDQKGKIWIATDGNGVSVFKDEDFLFYDENSTLDASSITAVLESSEGELWVATENGLSKKTDGAFINFEIPNNLFRNDEIKDLVEMQNGNLLMKTNNFELIEFDGTRFFRPKFHELLQGEFISDILVDEDKIMFSALRGLIIYQNGKLTSYSAGEGVNWRNEFNTLFKDSRDVLWLGSEGGLASFEEGEFFYLSEEEGLTGNRVYEIIEDSDGDLWVATNEGINVLSDFDETGKPQTLKRFNTIDLYLQETVFLQFDAFGGLWQGTNAGMNYYQLEDWKKTGNYTHIHLPLDDKRGVELNASASERDKNGTLWFGTSGSGLIAYTFHEGESSLAPVQAPETLIRQISAGNEIFFQQNQQSITPEPLSIPFAQNNVSIHVNAVSKMYPNLVHYRYRLVGLEEAFNNKM